MSPRTWIPRTAAFLGWTNALGAAGLGLLSGYFMLASLACSDLTDYQPTPIDKDDSLAVLVILRENKLNSTGVRSVSEVGQDGRIVGLTLASAGLTTMPPEIGDLTGLEELDLSYNKLKDLPFEMEKLADLERLELQGNLLATLPDGMRLKSLKSVDLRGNLLASLPGNFDITSVETMDLSNNRLTRLPPDFRFLHNLRTLNLERNRLDSLDIDFTLLTSLRSLDVSQNHLAYLDPTLAGTSPDYLDLGNNYLCFHKQDHPDSAMARQIAWLDSVDRDWRGTQNCP